MRSNTGGGIRTLA